MKDSWRYKLVGDEDWIFERTLAHTEDNLIDIIDGALPNPDEELDLHNIILSLPTKYSSILYEYYYDGKTLEEIGTSRGYSKQYAWQQIKKAQNMIKDRLMEE